MEESIQMAPPSRVDPVSRTPRTVGFRTREESTMVGHHRPYPPEFRQRIIETGADRPHPGGAGAGVRTEGHDDPPVGEAG